MKTLKHGLRDGLKKKRKISFNKGYKLNRSKVVRMKVIDLINLGEKALKMFNEYVVEEGVKPQMRVYIRRFLDELEISETSCRSQASLEIIHKPDWSLIASDFVEKKIKPMPEFKQLNQSIAKKYKTNINKLAKGCNEITQSAFWLATFIRRLIYEKLENRLSEGSVIEYASLFKSELELSVTEYRYVHYLAGIFLEDDKIRINDNVVIRKTQKDDLEYTRDIFFDVPRSPYMDLPSAILEIDIPAKDEKDCREYINRIFNSLRLYKLGSVYSKESISTKETIIWPMDAQRGWESINYSTFRKYTVKNLEVDTFINFTNTIEQKLNFDKEEKKYRSYVISIERFNLALLESVDIDRKLMTAVMGLESLFTFEKDRGENAFKLGIRVAKLLGDLNFDAAKVRTLTEEAYNFRNKVVHGSYISQEKKKKMNEIFPHILNYLRVSLIIFLLNQEIGKDKMIEIIDKSTISDIQNEELKKILEKDIREFGEVLT